MAQPYPALIPGLRSPFDQVNGLVYFGRMLDKMRLAAVGKLPAAWQAARGTTMKDSFDWRCCLFLKIDYAALEAQSLKGDKTDTELLPWAFQHGRQPGDQENEVPSLRRGLRSRNHDYITSGIGAAMIGWVRAARATGCATCPAKPLAKANALLRDAQGTPRPALFRQIQAHCICPPLLARFCLPLKSSRQAGQNDLHLKRMFSRLNFPERTHSSIG